MKWFNRIDTKRMDFIQSYIPTSKAQLIQVAMWYHRGDTSKAQEMVDFYTKNMQLPDFDPAQPTFMQQMKDGAGSLYGWLRENQGDLVQAYQFVRGIIKNKGELPFVPPATEVPLPPINE